MKRDSAALLFISLAAFGAARLAGVRFLDQDLATAWHLLDPELLRHDLFRSLFYLHSQPPLLNLLVGIGLKLGHPAGFLCTLWLGCSAAAALCTRALAVELGAARWPSLAAGALVAIAPSTLLYVHHVGPEMATAAALVASALFLARGRQWPGFVLLGVACLLRSLLAPPIVLVVLALSGRRALKPGLAVFAVLLALMAKNAAVAGTFSTSSWFGMNFARITALQLPPEKRPYMPMPFSEKIAREGHTGVEALDEVRKPSGAINYNNLMYARVSRRMIRDDLRSIAIEPGAYLRGVAAAWLLFFYPADVWPFTAANRLRMARWCGFWDNVLCARVDLPTPVRGVEALFATLLLGIPVSLAIAARDRRTWVALALVLSVAVLGNFAEMGENYRFRFLVGPLSAAVAAAGLSRKRSLRVPDSAAPAATA